MLVTFGQEINKPDESFESYLNSFKLMELPLNLDRKATFNLSKTLYNRYEKDTFIVVRECFSDYIPIDILENTPFKYFRCIYVLPKKDNFISVIIAEDFIYDDEQRKLKLYLINYNEKGNILDYLEIAGYHIDVSERFVEIDTDLKIRSNAYQFKTHPDKKNLDLAYLKEICRIYKINKNGAIIEVSETNKEGYYKGDWKGYSFIKAI